MDISRTSRALPLKNIKITDMSTGTLIEGKEKI